MDFSADRAASQSTRRAAHRRAVRRRGKDNLDPIQWKQRLADTFTYRGKVGGRLVEVIEHEHAYGEHVLATFQAHRLLLDSFLHFLLDTFRVCKDHLAVHGYPANSPYYRVVQVSFATNFRRLRAADLLSFYGYPLHGYALLRDLKDEAAYLAGVLHGLTSIRLLRGYGELSDPPTEESLRRLRTARKREQLRIRDLIYGKKSGLSADALRFIALWERLFHEEVHGSNLTLFVEAEDAFQGIDDFPVLPVPREQALGMFMNRSVEVAWLLLRVLPILQPAPGAFGAAWRSQWEVLEDSCGRYIDSFPEISQDFKAAIAELLQQRFPFSPNTAYSEGASV